MPTAWAPPEAAAWEPPEAKSWEPPEVNHTQTPIEEISGLPVAGVPKSRPIEDVMKDQQIPDIPHLPAHVEDALDAFSPALTAGTNLIRPSAVARAGIDMTNFLKSGEGLLTLGIGGLPAGAQRIVVGAMAAQAIKNTPDKVMDLVNSKTDDEKRQAQADLINNTLMAAGGATHSLSGEAAGARPPGASQLDINTAVKEGDLLRTADSSPATLDPIVQARDILKAQLDKEPNANLQKTHDAISNQLANVPDEVISESRSRISQQQSSTPLEAPTVGSIAETPPLEQSTSSSAFARAKAEIAPETAKAVTELPEEAPSISPAAEESKTLTGEEAKAAGDPRFQKVVEAEIGGLHEAADETEALDHMEGIEDDQVRHAIAKQYGIDVADKSTNDLNTEIAEKAMEVKNAAPAESNVPVAAEFDPPEEDQGLPKTSLSSGGTMTKRIAPLGITPKLPPFLEHLTDFMAGLTEHPAFKDTANALSGWLGSAAGRTFPRLTVLDRILGELGARWISSKIASKPSAMLFGSKVLEGLNVDPVKFGAALTEDNLRSVRSGHEATGDAEKAALVKTTISAKGSPFKTESDYQDFLNDPATKEAIKRHKAMWDSVIEPMYKKAMSIDPDVELTARGLQTGARINLHSIIEGESGDKIVTAGQGNLLGTMRKKSIFGRQATGAGETYGSNYFGIMDNTFAKQLEIANKNTFEDALVAKGFAKVDKQGQQIEINGRKAEAYPYKRQTVVLPGEEGAKAISQSRNIYIDPRFKGEYESGANILRTGISQSGPITAFSKLINNAALTGLTDATVHISNLATALFTRPGGNLLGDSLLSTAGRADIPVTITKAVMKAFSDNSTQLKELAEIGALRDSHPTASGPLGFTGRIIQGVDKVTRLALDDTYQKLADAGLVEKNETNRREFINQVGQYNKRAQSGLIRLLRDSGISPFVTAGKTFNALAVKTATLNPGLKAASTPAALALRANQISKWVGATALVGTLNYLITGKVAGRPGVPIGSIDTGKSDKNNRPLYIKAFDMMGLGRAMRVTGARGFLDATKNNLTTQDSINSAGKDIYNTTTAPFIGGPPVRFLSTIGNFSPAMGVGKPVAAVAPGENQMAANATQAVIQASPLVASLVDRFKTGGGVMESLQRQFPRYLPQSGKSEEFMAKYPEIVHRAQAREFTNDVISRARKLEPEAKKEFLGEALKRLAPSDRDQFERTLKYSHVY